MIKILFRYRKNSIKPLFRLFSDKSPVRVRFAPSPTGYLHLGGLRTVAFNYFFAKSQNGQFILRIEDTDRKRIVPESVKNLEEILAWLDFKIDEGPSQGGDYGPYLQSERLDLYRKEAQTLLDKNLAYKCFCSEDRLMLLRNEALKNRQTVKYDNKCRHLSSQQVEEKLKSGLPYVIRFKIEDKSSSFDDAVYGTYEYNFDQDGDLVIVKSDGYPTYHFANVVDDHHMKISHVLRGEEWLASTPKHVELYSAFQWSPPTFGHLPLLKGSQGVKLSKREKSAFVEFYKDKGYYPAALINSVCSTGGGFIDRDKQTLYNFEEFTKKFDLSTITRHGTRFEMDWLNIYNGEVIKEMPVKTLIPQLRSFVQKKYGALVSSTDPQYNVLTDSYLEKVINYGKDRISNLGNLMEEDLECFWCVPDEKFTLSNELLNSDDGFSVEMLDSSIDAFEGQWPPEQSFEKNFISSKFKDLARTKNFKKPKLLQFLRAAVTGVRKGLPVAETFEVLGREIVVMRLKLAADYLKNNKVKDRKIV